MSESFFFHQDQLTKEANPSYPDWLKKSYFYQTLTGPFSKIKNLEKTPFSLGFLEFAANKTYPPHHHPSAELYIILSGTADWTVNDVTQKVVAGSFIHHPSNAMHGWTVTSKEALKAIWVQWSEKMDTNELNVRAMLDT